MVVGTEGRHILVEYWGCDSEILSDLEWIKQSLCTAAKEAGANIVDTVFHRFTPHGVSGVVVVEESHLSIHTWPEVGYAAVDFYTCGDCKPERAIPVIQSALKAQTVHTMTVLRGLAGQTPSFKNL